MPLVRIDIPAHRDTAYRQKIAQAVHQALVDAVGVPPADRFQVITAHGPDGLVYDPSYLDVSRSPGFVVIHITFRSGRPPEKKRALYRAIADNVHEATGTRVEDVMIVLSENDAIDWSFGNGVAQYSLKD